MELKPIPQIKIYRDGQLSRWESMQPVLRAHAINTFEKINFWFVNSHWPTAEEQDAARELRAEL